MAPRGMQHSSCTEREEATHDVNMSNSTRRLENVTHALMSNGEPAEWVGRQPPEFTRRPLTSEEWTLNFSKYLTGYPWIVIAEDKGGTARYFCGICEGSNSDSHSLSRPHREHQRQVLQDAGVPNPTLDGELQGLQHHGPGKGPLRRR